MKTTLNIDDELMAKAKAVAVKEKTSATRLIEEGLRLRLRVKRAKTGGRRTMLPIYRGEGGLAGEIDPTRNESLYDAADS